MLPYGNEWHTAPTHVFAQGAANVELSAQAAAARFGIACGELFGHLPHQYAHALHVATLDVRQARRLQQLLTKLLIVTARKQQHIALDKIAHGIAQQREPRLQQCCAVNVLLGARTAQRLDFFFYFTQPHAHQNTACVQIFLRKEADVLDAGLASSGLHRRSETGAIILRQQLAQ